MEQNIFNDIILENEVLCPFFPLPYVAWKLHAESLL